MCACSYVNVVSVSFAQPDCTYVKGSLSLQGTGLSFSSDGPTVKAAIAALKAAQPNTRVMLAVGGATYTNFAAMNTACIKNIVDDFGFDGERVGSNTCWVPSEAHKHLWQPALPANSVRSLHPQA